MFVKHYAPKVFFVTDVLYNWISQFKISCTNVWRRNSFLKLLLKPFWQIWPGDLWPSDPKNNRVSLLSKMDVWTKFEEGRARHSQVIEGNGFGTFDLGDLELWPSDPSINMVSLLPRTMCGTSLRKLGQGVLELLIGNKNVTDGRTDRQTNRPTCANQYALSSLKGGIIMFGFKSWGQLNCSTRWTKLAMLLKQKSNLPFVLYMYTYWHNYFTYL